MNPDGGVDIASSESRRIPVAFRVGGTGLGAGVGCGVGIGFGQPLNLGGIPGLGQVLSGVNSGLSRLPFGLSNAGGNVRNALKKSGVRGLDAGLGCGVGIGYGFGVGLFVKPSAMEQFTQSFQSMVGRVANALPGNLGAKFNMTVENESNRTMDQNMIAPKSPTEPKSITTTPDVRVETKDSIQTAKIAGDVSKLQDTANNLMQSVIRLQNELDSLKQENHELKLAVCAVNKKAPFCKRDR